MDMKECLALPIFAGISLKGLEQLRHCLNMTVREYKKNEIIYHSGSSVKSMGLVLEGSCAIEHIDIHGKKDVIEVIKVGDIFAESYAAVDKQNLLVDVRANTNCKLLFMNMSKIIYICPHNCSFHSRLMGNLLKEIAQKNIILLHKIIHSSAKTVRDKLISYLNAQSRQNKSKKFKIPFDRQQLADYLNVNRSVLSNEISKMITEGLIYSKKNYFEIKY